MLLYASMNAYSNIKWYNRKKIRIARVDEVLWIMKFRKSPFEVFIFICEQYCHDVDRQHAWFNIVFSTDIL